MERADEVGRLHGGRAGRGRPAAGPGDEEFRGAAQRHTEIGGLVAAFCAGRSGEYDHFEVERVALAEFNPKATQSLLVGGAIEPEADRLLKR